jgi:hypothetical protein
MVDRTRNAKNLTPRVREQKCKDCGKLITFRYFRAFDTNGKLVKTWWCVFDAADKSEKDKHKCKQTPAAAVSPEKEKEIAAK